MSKITPTFFLNLCNSIVVLGGAGRGNDRQIVSFSFKEKHKNPKYEHLISSQYERLFYIYKNYVISRFLSQKVTFLVQVIWGCLCHQPA